MALTLEADYKRYCGLHSYYKHIPLTGRYFYAYLEVGEQPRNGISPEVSDSVGMHWWFTSGKPDPPKVSYKVRFGPFLRGIEHDWSDRVSVRGFNIIISDAGESWGTWIQEHYPHLAHIDWHARPRVEWTEPDAVREIYKKECDRYWTDLVTSILH